MPVADLLASAVGRCLMHVSGCLGICSPDGVASARRQVGARTYGQTGLPANDPTSVPGHAKDGATCFEEYKNFARSVAGSTARPFGQAEVLVQVAG